MDSSSRKKLILSIIMTLIIFLFVSCKSQEEHSTAVLSQNIVEESKDKVVAKETKKSLNNTLISLRNPTKGGYITSSFGERWGRMHKGIDISGNIGDPVMASFDGVVKSRFYEKDGYGNVIILEHDNGLETRYAHMNSFAVKEGSVVKKGDIIGSVGNTGRSTGPHLHFELRVNGSPVDPEGYIN